MKINPIYKVRKIAGESIVMVQGTLDADMTKIISLNKTAEELWKEFAGKEFTCDDAADYLVGKYGIGRDLAMADSAKWIGQLQDCGILE